jgi:hypothetical protein
MVEAVLDKAIAEAIRDGLMDKTIEALRELKTTMMTVLSALASVSVINLQQVLEKAVAEILQRGRYVPIVPVGEEDAGI